MRVLSTIVAASALIAMCGLSAHATPLHLSLKAEALVSGARVTLADLTTRVDGNGEHNDRDENNVAWRALAKIDLGSSPRAGYTTRMGRTEIERLVRARAMDSTVILRGADAVRVERVAQVFDSAKVAEVARTYLGNLLQGEADRVALQLSGALTDLAVPDGKLELKPRAMLPAQALHSRVIVWIDVIVDGVFVRSISVPFNVQAFRTALVAKRDLVKGMTPGCDALQAREIDVAALEAAPIPADCTLVQGSLKRNLIAGAPLLKSLLQAPIAVALGDNVSLQLVAGALRLESRAVAIADGEVGQRIAVRPTSSVETIVAEVVAPGVVKVTGK